MPAHPNYIRILVACAATLVGCTASNPSFLERADGGLPPTDAGHPGDAPDQESGGGGDLGAEVPGSDAQEAPADLSETSLPASCQAPVVVAGRGLNVEFFDNADFTGTRVARIDPVIDLYLPNTGPDPALGEDTFSGRWTGTLQPSVSGPHTFHATFNDGMRMFLDGRVAMYRWGLHPTTDESVTIDLVAGRKYPLLFEFYDSSGAAWARLAWTTPCQARQVIPSAHLHPDVVIDPPCTPTAAAGTGTGLDASYFSGPEFQPPVQARSGSAIDFDWASGAPLVGIPADNVSIRWQGRLQGPTTGPVTIIYFADDVGRLWLDDRLLMDSWFEGGGNHEVAATVDMVAGQLYDLRVEFQERTGNARARLYWTWPCSPRHIIPLARLYPPP